MPLDQDKLQSPIRKLRKSLRNPKPSPEQVHKLRTRSRRVEAIISALSFDQDRNARRMLDAISAIRRKAGKVRDMDVLTSYAAQLSADGEREYLTQLLEHLGVERSRYSRKLIDTIHRDGGEARRQLKDCSEIIKICFASKEKHQASTKEAMAAVLQISTELSSWPKLNRGNLHAFRLKVKDLRYILELAENPDAPFIDSLSHVKDVIGEWHDWSELANLSADILGRDGLKLTRQIREIAAGKFKRAVAEADRVRRRYFGQRHIRARGGRRAGSVNELAVAATMKFAA